MDCIDEVLEFYEDPDRTFHSTYIWSVKYIAKLANKKVSNFNETQFKYCLLLILNLFWIEESDEYNNTRSTFNDLDDLDKKILADMLKSEINS